MASPTLSRLRFRHDLDHHGIHIEAADFAVVPRPATPEKFLAGRKVKYTVAIGYRRITRETTLDRLSTELAAFIADRNASLVGIDGINGFVCGPTEDELRMFAHPLEEIQPQKMG